LVSKMPFSITIALDMLRSFSSAYDVLYIFNVDNFYLCIP
jgi:hypothetical protein